MDETPKNNRFSAFCRPFVRCRENLFVFSIWSAFAILGGLLGFLFNLVQRCILGQYSFQEVLYIDSVNGSFYIFSIVLTSSVLAPIFLQIAESRTIKFRKIKTGFVVFSIFILLFGSVFYSVYSSSFEIPIPDTKLSVDWCQLFFFIVSLIIAIYSFGIKLIDDNPKENDDIREKSVRNKVKEDSAKAAGLTEDGEVKL